MYKKKEKKLLVSLVTYTMYVRMYLRMLGSSTATVTEFPKIFLVFEKWQDLTSDHRNSEQGV